MLCYVVLCCVASRSSLRSSSSKCTFCSRPRPSHAAPSAARVPAALILRLCASAPHFQRPTSHRPPYRSAIFALRCFAAPPFCILLAYRDEPLLNGSNDCLSRRPSGKVYQTASWRLLPCPLPVLGAAEQPSAASAAAATAHTPRLKWDATAFIRQLRRRRHSWRDIFWFLWGISTVAPLCRVCGVAFPAAELGCCAFHNQRAVFNPGREVGVFACCGAAAFRKGGSVLARPPSPRLSADPLQARFVVLDAVRRCVKMPVFILCPPTCPFCRPFPQGGCRMREHVLETAAVPGRDASSATATAEARSSFLSFFFCKMRQRMLFAKPSLFT